MKKLGYAVVLLSIAVCFSSARLAMAQMSLMVSPIRVDQQVKAGSEETNVIDISNHFTDPTRIAVHVEDWTMNRKGDVGFSPAGGDPSSCAKWIKVNPTDFRLEPAQNRQIRYSLSVPPDAKEGGYRAAIILEGKPLQVEGAAKRVMTLNGRIVVIVYATVGAPEVKAQFQDFQVAAGNKEVSFKITMVNQGDAHFRVKKSFITLKNQNGEEVGKVEVPDIPVLPGATRDLEFKKEITLPKGTYLAEAVLDVGKEDFLGRKNSFSVGR